MNYTKLINELKQKKIDQQRRIEELAENELREKYIKTMTEIDIEVIFKNCKEVKEDKMKFKTSKNIAIERIRIPEGIYIAELKEVKDVSEGKFGERVAFIYRIIERNEELALVCYKAVATQNNKLGQTLIAHGLNLGEEIDTTEIIGKKVRAWVEDFTYLDNEDKEHIASIIVKVKPPEEKV